ncbi:DUF2802 domain-containing protein [Psychromonas sp. MME2]|uniref:DUF2802 domain-containing protein n=1 Tax=unclassified Psychromonas TaxID=2614957 RepID=UPI00339C34FC
MLLSYIPWIALLLSIILFVVNYLFIKKQQLKINELQSLVESLTSNNASFKRQFTEAHAVSLGMGKKIQKFEKMVKQIQENHSNLVAQAPENRLYTRAMKMVELGASIDELMVECELPRAEAELLLNLHKK